MTTTSRNIYLDGVTGKRRERGKREKEKEKEGGKQRGWGKERSKEGK